MDGSVSVAPAVAAYADAEAAYQASFAELRATDISGSSKEEVEAHQKLAVETEELRLKAAALKEKMEEDDKRQKPPPPPSPPSAVDSEEKPEEVAAAAEAEAEAAAAAAAAAVAQKGQAELSGLRDNLEGLLLARPKNRRSFIVNIDSRPIVAAPQYYLLKTQWLGAVILLSLQADWTAIEALDQPGISPPPSAPGAPLRLQPSRDQQQRHHDSVSLKLLLPCMGWPAACAGWTVKAGVEQLRQLVELLTAEAGEEIDLLLNATALAA